MTQKIQVKRGLKANLPTLSAGEPAFTTDTKQVFIGDGTTNYELAKQSDLNTTNINVTNLNYVKDTSAELTRDTIPSGYIQLSDLDYIYMSANPNTIKSSSDSIVYVNGYKVIIPSGTVITLNAPPTTGTRDDLVFLECWKQTDVNGLTTWNARIRVVDGVDFTKKFGSGNNGIDGYIGWDDTTVSSKVTMQGGNASPIISDTNNYINTFRSATYVTGNFLGIKDSGLWIWYPPDSWGVSSPKDYSKTSDGYVYAIPMFKVHRRNSSGYSVSNGNGSELFVKYYCSAITLPANTDTTVTLNTVTNLNVGDYLDKLINSTTAVRRLLKVKAINGTSVTLSNLSSSSLYIDNNQYMTKSIRSDNVFADTIDVRDIIDLRHKVSLTGYNYQQLLEENFDKLLRGELQTSAKTTMLKTYHGINKTTTDANTIFYASLDGTATAEIGGNPSSSINSWSSSCTGLGLNMTSSTTYSASVYPSVLGSTLTSQIYNIDFWIKRTSAQVNNTGIMLVDPSDTTKYLELVFVPADNYIHLATALTTTSWDANVSISQQMELNTFLHLRLTFNISTGSYKIYKNGNLIGTGTLTITSLTEISKLTNVMIVGSNAIISDVSISNIDRGTTFSSLPKDFIDGYARIDKAFNNQRDVFSDSLTSEIGLSKIKCTGGNTKEITVGDSSTWTKSDTSKWNNGDRIKIKGLGNEIISGIVDVDTSITRIVQNSTAPVTLLYLDDVSKFSVNDTIKVYDTNANNASNDATITAIDTVNKTITLSSAINNGSNWNVWINQLVIESTANSSVPTIKSNLTGTAQAGASSTITLASTFSATDSFYNGLTITITGGTGNGQVRTISGYVGSTKIASVSSAWTTNPDNTSTYLITGVPITGTWSGLGTNEITFTLGTNNGLTNQDIWINYGLTEYYGQGGISEVLTTTLAGESNGKKLTVNPTIHIRDDFAGKIAGDTTICPNTSKYNVANTLSMPSAFSTEISQSSYNTCSKLDSSSVQVATTANGGIPQQLSIWNIIREFEDKYGTLPCATDTASKIACLKANIKSINFNAWIYGSCPSGNKANLSVFNPNNNTWGVGWYTNNANAPTLGTATFNTDYIDANGNIFLLSYTDASNGVIQSAIYTDYCYIDFVLNTPIGYDVLAPENPRRDDGKGNILLVRKETKEIQTMFPRANTDGVITYGEYIPYQGGNFTLGQNMNIITQGNYFMLSTSGTGKAYLYQNQDTSAYYNIEVNHNLPTMYNDYQFINDNISWGDLSYPIIQLPPTIERHIKRSKDGDVHTGYFNIPTWSVSTIRGKNALYFSGGSNSEYARFSLGTIAKNTLKAIMYLLINDAGTLKLFVLTSDISLGSKIALSSLQPWCAVDVFNITNRPLIK